MQHPYFTALLLILTFGIMSWAISLFRKDVSFVDSLWPVFFLVAAAVYALDATSLSVRAKLVLVLLGIWAIRLSLHITIRNWGGEEDPRYQTIRANNEPGFALKSIYIVFGLQAVLAWFVAFPLFPAITSHSEANVVDALAAVLWLFGFVYEAGGDYQLMKFKAQDDSRTRVLNTGFWRHTRHPNYFGEFCIWWAFYLFAVAAGSWWTVASPLLMSLLLLKVSGVAMLEKTIGSRRPGYAEYVECTNAFFPGPLHRRSVVEGSGQ